MTDQVPGPRPSGTVYGRGGVEMSGSAPDRLPRAMIAGVVVGVVAVLGLGYAAWSSTGGAEQRPAAAATSAPTEPAPAPTKPAKPQLTAGSWLLSPLDDEATYLTATGEYAKMSPADPATLTVSAGLADDTCFSFRLEDGRYLRHFDYRLRFDASDDSDLFRADATFCREAGTDAGTIRLRSKNYPDHVVHRRDDDSLYIDKESGTSFMVQVPS
ncbi:AbfB domain-containing protein [Actinoplanes xinjiangensis]|uniref:AbfB domain-containing protein n=1 Tax=Actinoplanes xinjiangensis TaxID=512350 RepID=UPI003427732B